MSSKTAISAISAIYKQLRLEHGVVLGLMSIIYNLVPRFSLLPVERPWLGLVTCLPESGRLQTNDLGEGRISVRFVSTKCRRRD